MLENIRQSLIQRKMSTNSTIIFYLVLTAIVVEGKYLRLEAERFRVTKNKPWLHQESIVGRSRASKEAAIHAYQNDILRGDFCLAGHNEIQITNVQYSNNGPSDKISVSIDRKYVGTINARTHVGRSGDWNYYMGTAQVGKSLKLAPGRHMVTLNVTEADQYGAELDVLIVKINDDNITQKMFDCDIFCFADITYDKIDGNHDSVQSAKFSQLSKMGSCAEEDNVKIAIYQPSAKRFEITATGPQYKSYSNNIKPDYRQCRNTTPIWEYRNETVDPRNVPKASVYSHLKFGGTFGNIEMDVMFTGVGLLPNNGEDNLNIGSRLYVTLGKLESPVEVLASYIDRKRQHIKLHSEIFSPSTPSKNWTIPDITWIRTRENVLKFTFKSFNPVFVETVGLETRKIETEIMEIFNDDEFIIETIKMDFWWRNFQSMSVTLQETKINYKDLTCILISHKEQWVPSGRSQILKICQDGHLQVLSPTPHGLDKIVFGSTVIVGPSDPHEKRSHADIRHIDIDASLVKLNVFYVDKSSLSMAVTSRYLQTKVLVENVSVVDKAKLTLPIMTYQSMWLEDGNANVDRIAINGNRPRHIMHKWGQLYGVVATFFRQCISSHYTQSPDIQIQVLPDK